MPKITNQTHGGDCGSSAAWPWNSCGKQLLPGAAVSLGITGTPLGILESRNGFPGGDLKAHSGMGHLPLPQGSPSHSCSGNSWPWALLGWNCSFSLLFSALLFLLCSGTDPGNKQPPQSAWVLLSSSANLPQICYFLPIFPISQTPLSRKLLVHCIHVPGFPQKSRRQTIPAQPLPSALGTAPGSSRLWHRPGESSFPGSTPPKGIEVIFSPL